MDNTPHPIPATLESITRQKAEVLQKIQAQKKTMSALTQEIFAPLKPAATKTNFMMRSFNTGLAVFDGIVLGVKVMKKFKRLFGRKR